MKAAVLKAVSGRFEIEDIQIDKPNLEDLISREINIAEINK